jgi:hypothetical protein
VCGTPCYEAYGIPVLGGLKNADEFLGKYKKAFDAFNAKAGFPEGQGAIFQSISDNIGDFAGTKKIGGAPAVAVDDVELAPASMDR